MEKSTKTEREERHPFLDPDRQRQTDKKQITRARIYKCTEKQDDDDDDDDDVVEREITHYLCNEVLQQLFSLCLSLSSQNNPKNFFGFSSFASGAFFFFFALVVVPFLLLLFFLASASRFACSIFFLRSSCILRISSGFISGPNPPKALMMGTFLLLPLLPPLLFCFRCCRC